MRKNELYLREVVPETNLIVSKLAIDRCRNHVSHLHALIHTCICGCEGCDESIIESARLIIAGLELDLDCSANVLSRVGMSHGSL